MDKQTKDNKNMTVLKWRMRLITLFHDVHTGGILAIDAIDEIVKHEEDQREEFREMVEGMKMPVSQADKSFAGSPTGGIYGVYRNHTLDQLLSRLQKKGEYEKHNL